MNYLVAAYVVLWAISFVLIVSMTLRQRRLESEIQALTVLVGDQADETRGR